MKALIITPRKKLILSSCIALFLCACGEESQKDADEFVSKTTVIQAKKQIDAVEIEVNKALEAQKNQLENIE